MDGIRESCDPRRIRLIEDACQAHGARYKKQRVAASATPRLSAFT
jgi:dTDP-4-amino-4,6-dideoxygalactose transaminase